LKSIISRVANSVMGWTLRPVDTRPEGPRAGVGFLTGGSEPPPHQIWGLWEHCKLLQRGFGFWSILGPQKSRHNGQLAFESGGGATSESGGKCPNVDPRLSPPPSRLRHSLLDSAHAAPRFSHLRIPLGAHHDAPPDQTA